jgi:hypothetical protein
MDHISIFSPTSTVDRALGVAWVLLKHLVVDGLQLRAAQASNDVSDGSCKLVQRVEENVGLGLGRKLVEETAEVVALCQRLCVEHSASEVFNVHAGERILSASVTAAHSVYRFHTSQSKNSIHLPANVEELWVESSSVDDVSKEILGFVWVDVGAFVLAKMLVESRKELFAGQTYPVIRNTLSSLLCSVLTT